MTIYSVCVCVLLSCHCLTFARKEWGPTTCLSQRQGTHGNASPVCSNYAVWCEDDHTLAFSRIDNSEFIQQNQSYKTASMKKMSGGQQNLLAETTQGTTFALKKSGKTLLGWGTWHMDVKDNHWNCALSEVSNHRQSRDLWSKAANWLENPKMVLVHPCWQE